MRRWFLPTLLVVLSILSILLLKSVAPSVAGSQFIFFLIGSVIFYLTSVLPWSLFIRWRWVAYISLCLLLVVPLVLGSTTRGIAGWIDIGTLFSIQPSQLAIPILGILMAYQIHRYQPSDFIGFLRIIGLMVLPAGLIVVEPDLGTAVIFVLTMGVLLWFSRIPLKYLATLGAIGLVIAIFSWSLFLQPYQKARITSFISSSDTEQEASGASYNAQQALIAVGSGQVIGRGLGQGVQSHLRFLPERQTDFIFASLAEELGFVGSILVVGVYVMLSLFCVYIAIKTTDPVARLYCLAIAGATILQSSVNMGMNMGLFPITGITLPFLSYGGSSVLSMALTYGLVQNIARNTRPSLSLHLT